MHIIQSDGDDHVIVIEELVSEYVAHLSSHRDLVESSLCRHRRCSVAFLCKWRVRD
jgi:hypothetical protein